MTSSSSTLPAGWKGLLRRVLGGGEQAAARVVRVRNANGGELGERIEVADTGARRKKGLLGRKRLAPGEGLWIVPCESVHTFGMQFAIDLVYLDRRMRILKVRHAVKRSRISICLRAHSVLELPAGAAQRVGVAAGDALEFEYI